MSLVPSPRSPAEEIDEDPCWSCEIGADWSVEEIELDEPKAGEILVKTTAAGMCHSDEHAHDGTMPVPLPIIGGHEGAGVVIGSARASPSSRWVITSRARSSRRVASAPGALAASRTCVTSVPT